MSVRSWSAQKAGLTRAIKSGDPDKVKAECVRAVAEWDSRQAPYTYGWPDDWARWQRALDDVLPWHQMVSLVDVAYKRVSA